MQCNVELSTNSVFALLPRKTTESVDEVCWSQDLLDANWPLASSPALNTLVLTLVPICAVFFLFFLLFSFSLETFTSCFYKHFYVYIIWISTKPCITPAEGMNAYMHKYAYKYTYICICDSLIIGKFGNPLYFVKISCYTRFVAHPVTSIMFHSSILLFFLMSNLQT
jgi:hypothetical protein